MESCCRCQSFASCPNVARGSCCRRSTHALSKRKHDIPRRLLQRFHWNVEVCGVHYTVALKLHPHAIHSCSREDHVELNVGSAIGNERMRVDEVDQIVAGRQHVSPHSEIFLKPVARIDVKAQLSVLTGKRLRWDRHEIDLKVLRLLLVNNPVVRLTLGAALPGTMSVFAINCGVAPSG